MAGWKEGWKDERMKARKERRWRKEGEGRKVEEGR
jgi:hypothetical protein